ncbi:hypothetical protein [Alistipes putredinis]|uniref:hypothetical protein n=1 Tax=Alistipes putredinis TaxID=28117 RepID=UPI0024ACBD17|nr:hypothetical protein [Alistipes putredinis]
MYWNSFGPVGYITSRTVCLRVKAEVDGCEFVGGQTFVRGGVIAIHSGKKMRVLLDVKQAGWRRHVLLSVCDKIVFNGNLVLIRERIAGGIL